MTQAGWTDRAVNQPTQDKLGFDHYCQVLSQIVTEADTPLTIGIFGPWGSGKTSLMRLVEAKLKTTEGPPGPPEGGETNQVPPSGGLGGPLPSGGLGGPGEPSPSGGPDRPSPLTVWFNAWKYDQEEALWRALIIQVLNVFRPDERGSGIGDRGPGSGQVDQVDLAAAVDEPARPARDQMKPDLPPAEARLTREQEEELNERLDDLEASLYRTVEREEVGGVTIDWDKLLKGSIMGITHLSLSALPGVGAVLGKMMEKAQEQITGQDINTIFEAIQRERRKIYREHVRSLEQFQQKFEELVQEEVLAKDRRLVIFIDDLDRCLPEKAIEVLEALKLFLDVPGCVFFLGVDRKVIQDGIRVKYKGFLVNSDDPAAAGRRIPITGDDYLEKIVQLPFHLLPLDEARVEQFIKTSGIELPAGCADIFAAGLEANPRKVKRTLNIFRLLHALAQIRQDEFKVNGQPVKIKPQLLAKVVVIQSRYRELYNDLVEYPALLPDLERHFAQQAAPTTGPTSNEAQAPASPSSEAGQGARTTGPGPGQQTLLKKYQHLRPLQRLLSRGDRFAGLPLAEVKLYLYLTYTTDESGQATAAEHLAARWWRELLSNDLTKIKSTLAAIQEDEATVTEFQARLVAALAQAGAPYTPHQRFSAGTALALLGDPRDFGEMIPVPPGEYPLDVDNVSAQPVEGFKIGKYPVTNRQYQKFLEANPDHPAPDHWDQATRTYPPALANHPVANVTWHDAQTYCRWAGKRLLSAQEWEVAARGAEWRFYPYGNEPRFDVANTAEMGLNQQFPL